MTELQSLRGIAAMVVLLSHGLLVYELSRPYQLFLDVVFNAHAAVILFFVLSGYVLAGSLMRIGIDFVSIMRFGIRRILRLYPAIIVATIVGAIVMLALGELAKSPRESSWFTAYSPQQGFSTKALLLSL